MAVFCASVLAGVGLGRVISFSGWYVLPAVLLVFVMARKRNITTICLVMAAGVLCGGFQGTRYAHRLSAYDPLYGHKTAVVGYAVSDGTYGKQSQLTFDMQGMRLLSGTGHPLAGTLGIGGFGENMIFRGDEVEVTGTLRPGSGSRQGWMSYAQLHVIHRSSSFVDDIRRKFNAGMLTALPEPLASFGMGLLIGGHSSLPPDVYQDLLMVGLVHIIAVSGYNLTIILRAAMRLFGRRSKYQTLLFSICLIAGFLLLTGSSASIVRASIVSGLSLIAWYYGRVFRPVTLILLAAAVTGLANPLYVWGDVGWYLSFLAFYGVLVLAPQIRSRVVPGRFQESILLSVALESLAAEIMTIPLVLFVFGQMSLAGLLANLLVAVFVPLAMLLAAVAGLAGMFVMPVAGWLSWPAMVLLTYMLDTAHLLSRIPHVFVTDRQLSLAGMLVLYAAVLLLNLTLHSQQKRKRAIITVDKKVDRQAVPYLYAAE